MTAYKNIAVTDPTVVPHYVKKISNSTHFPRCQKMKNEYEPEAIYLFIYERTCTFTVIDPSERNTGSLQ